MKLQLGYALSLLRVAEPADLARALRHRLRGQLVAGAPRLDEEAVRAAADALGRAPRLFTSEPLQESYRVLFPDALGRFRQRAAAILDHEVELFGTPYALGRRIDWRRDPLTGRRVPQQSGLFPEGVDPKGVWEVARAGALVELGAACRLWPELIDAARTEVVAWISSFLDENAVGIGIHYQSPLEVALRALHWLAALELTGGARLFPRPFVESLAARLLADGHFLSTHLENRGLVPANHLVADWLGLWTLGLVLDGAPGARKWQAAAERGLAGEAVRQVGRDGAHFEASTAYHRFALELFLVAHLWARAADRDSPVAEPLHRMFGYLAGYLGPDGCEPAFGDGDDARLLPLVPHPARRHDYLLPIGAVLFSDPSLRPLGTDFSEEALWLCGPAAWEVWSWLPPRRPPRAVSFPTGGVHVLRSEHWQVELRSGSYGQKGVGGHAHNDQLALVAWLDGRPLVVDCGTGRYAADPPLRDRFRGTAAHSTLVVEGAEQSPILATRPFALIDRARAAPVRLEDTGRQATLWGEHEGYRRLPVRLLHRRGVVLRRDLEVVWIRDELSGRGQAAVELRWHLLPKVAPLPEALRTRLAPQAPELEAMVGPLHLARGLLVGDAVLLCSFPVAVQETVTTGFFSPCYGAVAALGLVSFRARLNFPATINTLFIRRGS